jgi:O-antigen/teichoic acid export membrane protein
MSVRDKQIKNSFIYIVAHIVTNFLPVVTLPIFTRILTAQEYGVYALAGIYAVLFSGIVNFGMTISYERNFFQYSSDRESAELLYSTLVFVLTTFFLSTVFTYLFQRPVAKLFIGSEKFAPLLCWVFLSTVMMSFKQYFLIYFKNKERARDFVFYTLDESIISVVFSLIFVVYFRTGIVGLAWGQCLASFIILALLVARFFRVMPVCFNFHILKDSFRISLPLTPRIFMGVISTHFNKYALSLLNNLGGVGLFSIAQRIANVGYVFMTTLQNVFNPHIYKIMFSDDPLSGEKIGKYLTPFIYLSILICMGISLFSEEIVTIFTGPSFHGASSMVTILSMFYGFLFFGKINGTQLIYKKKTFVTSGITIFDMIVGALISIVLIKAFGVVGAAWATFFGGVITGVVTFIFAQRYFYVKWEKVKVAVIFGLFCLSSLVLLFLLQCSVGYSMRLGIKLFFLFVYLYCGVCMGILTINNVRIIKNIFAGKTSLSQT